MPPPHEWAQPNSPTGSPGPFPPAPAQGPSALVGRNDNAGSHRLLRIVAALVVLGGLIVAIAPTGNWHQVSFGGLGLSVTGYGHDRHNEAMERLIEEQRSAASLLSVEMTGNSIDVDAAADVSNTENRYDWILAPVPDGKPVTGLGLLIVVAGLTMLLRSRTSAADSGREQRAILKLSGVLIVGAAAGVAWTTASWRRFDRQLENLMGEVLQDDPAASMLLADVRVEPGSGLTLATIALVAVGVLGVVAFLLVASGNQQLPITVTLGTPGSEVAPVAPSAAPPTGTWSTGGPWPTAPPQGFPPHGGFAPSPQTVAPAPAPPPASPPPPAPTAPQDPEREGLRYDSWNDYPA